MYEITKACRTFTFTADQHWLDDNTYFVTATYGDGQEAWLTWDTSDADQDLTPEQIVDQLDWDEPDLITTPDGAVLYSHTWYAVMEDNEDNDWGSGSYDKAEAIEMVQAWRADGSPDAYIAVIDETNDEAFCIDAIHDFDEED